MQFALFIVEMKPTDTDDFLKMTKRFIQELKAHSQKPVKASMLNPCTYLSDLSLGMHDIAALSAAAEACGLTARTLFFPDAPAFVVSEAAPGEGE